MLRRAAVERLLARLGALTVGERGALPCLEPGRADLIVPGAAVVLATMDLDAPAPRDRERLPGLREGILIRLASEANLASLLANPRSPEARHLTGWGPASMLIRKMDEIAVLVLNATYEPLHFTNARRAVTLLLAGKAEAVEASPRVIRSPSRVFALPAVIRLAVFIRKPFLDRVAFNKKNILRRDGYTCQYCNRRGERLTVDHIVPRSRGGDTSWTNVVAACLRCNLKKGNRLPDEVGMRLSARARASEVRVLHPHAEAPARALAAGLVAEVPRRRPDALLASPARCVRLTSEYSPRGDQPQAIDDLTGLVRGGRRHAVLRGVTGSGKTYTIANLIASVNRPTLVLSPNKTLAAQLFSEFKAFFPDNAVEYFVSYYDYYQPEAYIPQSDTYIEKDALINDEIDRMRHSATRSLLERRDVIVVASVSCIYGIGAPETYAEMHLALREGDVDRPRRDHPPAHRRAVRAQRLRLPPGDVPRARRRGRGVPGQRGVARRSASSCSATRSTPSTAWTRSRGRCRSGSPRSTSTRPATT